MKKELTLVLKEKIGDCEIELETMQGQPARIDIRFKEDGDTVGFFQFDDYHLASLADFFLKAHKEVEKLNGE